MTPPGSLDGGDYRGGQSTGSPGSPCSPLPGVGGGGGRGVRGQEAQEGVNAVLRDTGLRFQGVQVPTGLRRTGGTRPDPWFSGLCNTAFTPGARGALVDGRP